MSELGRVLPFRKRRGTSFLPQEEAAEAADFYLAMEPDARSNEVRARYLSDIDVLLAICSKLKDERDRSPKKVASEAIEAYEFVAVAEKIGVFDERRYALGELAHLAAGAKRFLGEREQVEFWLCRAESAFRRTVNPTGCLTQVSYTRLALLYDMGRHEDVLELLPEVRSAFADLGMARDHAKAGLFQAMVLKMLNRPAEARPLLESLADDPCVRTDAGLYGRILVDLGDTEQLLGQYAKAICAFQKAMPLLEATRQPMAVADLQSVVASTYRNLGRFAESAEAFAQAKASFAGLGMRVAVVYMSVLRAEALLAISRHREAEMELLGALPTIEEQKMVPEGFAAVALLKESVHRRKTDPNALRELREHLQANR